jgi:hypothetical protein
MTFLFYHYLEKTAEEKTANVANKLVSGVISGAGKMLKNDWRQMGQQSWGRFNQAMTVLPAALTVPGLANKYDDQGRSRAERLTSLGGNIAGGMIGNQMGNRMGSSIAKNLGGGKIGRGLGFAASMAGGMGGSIAGETIASSPFKALSKPAPQPQYGLNANNPPNPQSSYPSNSLNQQ